MADDVNLSQDSIRQLAEMLGRGNSAAATPKSAPATSGNFSQLAQESITAATALAGVGASGHEASKGLQAIVSGVAGVTGLNKFGSAINSGIQSLEDLRTSNIKAANAGIGANNIGELTLAARKAGLTQDEYTQQLKQGGIALSGLGGTAEKGSERLLKLGNAVVNTEGGVENLGHKMMVNGQIAADELGKIAVVSQYGSKVNLDDANSRAKATQFVGQLASEIDKTAKITGKSRDAIESELAERLKSPTIVAAMNQMNEDQREQFVKTQAAMSGMGKGVSDLGATLAIGGRLSQEQQRELAAMGPAAGEFQKAMRMSALATTESEKKQADAALKRAQADINAFQNSAQFSNMMARSTPEMAAALKKSYEENQLRGRQAAEQRDTGLSPEKAAQKQQEEVQLAQAGKKLDTKTGQVTDDQNQKASQALAEAQDRARINTLGMIQAQKNFADTLTTDKAVLSGFNNVIDAVFGPKGSIADASKRVGDLGAAFVKLAGGTSGTKAPVKDYSAEKGVAPPPAKENTREGGTLEKTGSPVEPQDAIVKIHKGETVLTPDATKAMGKQLSDGSKDKGGVDVGAISEKINTTISSVNSSSSVKSASENKPDPAQQAIVDQFKDSSKDTVTMMINAAKRGMNESSKTIAEGEDKISEIRKKAADAGRELTSSEQRTIAHTEEKIAVGKQDLAEEKLRFDTLSNLDALKSQTEIDAKKATVVETIKSEDLKKAAISAGLKVNENLEQSSNKDAAEEAKAKFALEIESARTARDAADEAANAIEAKAKAEGRELTESEQARVAELDAESSMQNKKLNAARDGNQALIAAEEAKAKQAAELAKPIKSITVPDTESDEAETKSLNSEEIEKAKLKSAQAETKSLNSEEIEKAKLKSAQAETKSPISDEIEKTKLQAAQAEKISKESIAKPQGIVTAKDQFANMFSSIKLPEIKIPDGAKSIKVPSTTQAASTIKPKSTETEQAEKNKAAKEAENAKAKAEEKIKAQQKPAEKPAGEVTLKDLHHDLQQLNKTMMSMVSHTKEISEASHKTAKATSAASGNRNLV